MNIHETSIKVTGNKSEAGFCIDMESVLLS